MKGNQLPQAEKGRPTCLRERGHERGRWARALWMPLASTTDERPHGFMLAEKICSNPSTVNTMHPSVRSAGEKENAEVKTMPKPEISLPREANVHHQNRPQN